jgi:iron complex transport system ATP-binding protein
MLKLNNFSNSILKNISLSLENENLVILGSNGAGKTTLAHLIAGITPNESIMIDSINPSKVYGNARTKLVNYTPPTLEIFDDFLSVFEFLELNMLHSNFTIDTILERFNIVYLKNRACKKLSSGEAQLVLSASAILHGAKYTILDEPTSNLDPQKVQMMYHILKDDSLFNHRIIITHNLNLAYKLGYKIAFIHNKTIEFFGKSEDFFSDSNLLKTFGSSVKKENDSIMIDLEVAL